MTKHSTPAASLFTATTYLLAMAGLLICVGYYRLGTSGLALALGIGAVVVATGIPRGSAVATMLHLGAIPLDARRGTRDAAALLASLYRREVRGVLAHEIAHIQANDVWLASLAGSIRRFTGGLALVGGLGLLFTLPALALGVISMPLPVVLLMLAAPALSGLLRMALARSREFNADRVAATLSGDPRALASALVSLERRARAWWELMFGYRAAPPRRRG